MKEKIYTIPVNEAYDKECECPLCELEKQLEREGVSYALGAAMMEPDYRVASNEKGYCNHHFKMMFEIPKKLPLALVLDTHLEEIRKKLEKFDKQVSSLEKDKAGLFKKSSADKTAAEIADILGATEKQCMVCEKMNKTMEKFIDVLLYMWAADDEFKAKFDRSKGVCLKHFKMLTENVTKSLKPDKQGPFLAALIKKQSAELKRIQDDVHKFTLSFDYRNKDMELGTAADAPIRTIEKISGYINNEVDKEV